MAGSSFVDLERLLAPIGAENPAGPDPVDGPAPLAAYYEAKDSRDVARKLERRILSDPLAYAGEQPDWNTVLIRSTKALEETKHIQLVVWTMEALVRLHRFAGLADGLALAAGFLEGFWDTYHPRAVDGDQVNRVRAIEQVAAGGPDSLLAQPLHAAPITEDGNGYGVGTYAQAKSLEKLNPDKRAAAVKEGRVELAMIKAEAARSSPAFVAELKASIARCRSELARVGDILRQKLNADAPPMNAVDEALVTCQQAVVELYGDAPAADPVPAAATTGTAASPPTSATTAMTQLVVPAGSVQSRQQALQMVRQLAEFFDKTEPHSPLSHALLQVARWGEMKLPELWSDLVSDSNARDSMFRLVGIRDKAKED